MSSQARDQSRGTSEFDAERGNSIIPGPLSRHASETAFVVLQYGDRREKERYVKSRRAANGADPPLDSIAITKFMTDFGISRKLRDAITLDISIVTEILRR